MRILKCLIAILIIVSPISASADTKYSEESIKYTIQYVFADLGIGDEMVQIAKCESNFRNLVNILDTNKKRSVGIFQLNGGNAVDDWHIPYNNAKKARELYLNGGFRHWHNCSLKLGLYG